jgi:hypothetical protein
MKMNWTTPEPTSSDLIPYEPVAAFATKIDYANVPLPRYLQDWKKEWVEAPRIRHSRAAIQLALIVAGEMAAGRWLIDKARQWANDSGTYQAARNLRKWNVPLNLARQMLL